MQQLHSSKHLNIKPHELTDKKQPLETQQVTNTTQ